MSRKSYPSGLTDEQWENLGPYSHLPYPAAVSALASALACDGALVRSHAAWALGRIGGAAARSALSAAQGAEPDATVAHEITLALAGV